MERVLTPEGLLSDTDDTGTTSMISSLLGDETPNYIAETGYQPTLPEIPELNSSTYVSPRSLHAYTGPGKMIDASFRSESQMISDATPVADKMKAVLGSIERLKTSSHHSLKGSTTQLSSQSNAAISQVINALHTHDLTMKSLKDALNEIDIITEESAMERKSPSKFSSLRQLNRSQRILNRKDGESMITKEWVQNEVEIQIEYLRKSLNIDQIQKVLIHLKKENVEEREYRAHFQDLIKHEVNNQFKGIKDSSQNLQIFDKIEDLVSSKNDELQSKILHDVQQQLRLILQDETDKIMSTVSESTPDFVTQSELQLALQEALTNFNINNANNISQSIDTSKDEAVMQTLNQLNEQVELLKKNMHQMKASKINEDLESRIIKLEALQEKSTEDVLEKKINNLENDLEKAFKILDSNSKTQEQQQSEITRILNAESYYKKDLSSKTAAVEQIESNSHNIAGTNSELERRMSVLENQLKEITNSPIFTTNQDLNTQEVTNIKSGDDHSQEEKSNEETSELLLPRVLQLEEMINALKTQMDTISSSLSNENKLLAMDKKVSQLDQILKKQISEINGTKQTLTSLTNKSKEEAETRRMSSIQDQLSLLETEVKKIKNYQDSDEFLTNRMNSIIDVRLADHTNTSIKKESAIQESISKLHSDIVSQQAYIDSKLSEYQTVVHQLKNTTISPDKFDLINKKLVEVSNKVDKLNSEVVVTKESITKLDSKDSIEKIQRAIFQSGSWNHFQDQISQLSGLVPKLASVESDIQEKLSEVKAVKTALESLRKSLDQTDNSVKLQQNKQSSLDVNTRFSVLTNRISEVESRSKILHKVNINDLSQDIHEVKMRMDRLDSLAKSLDEKILSITMKQTSGNEKIDGYKDVWESGQQKIAEIESLIKTVINSAIRKIESDFKDHEETLRTMNNNIKSLQEEKSSAQLEAWITSHISKLRQELESKFENKVDNDVLEELVKHLATRDELKKVAKKKMGSISERRSNENIRSNERLKSNVLDDFAENKHHATNQQKLKKELETYLADQIKSLEGRLRTNESFFIQNEISGVEMDMKAMQSIKKYTESLINDKMKLLINNQASSRARKEGAAVSDDEIDLLEQKMRREFDEKLFLLCSDLSSCKNMIASQLYEPFHRCAQWIWKSGHLKLGSAVPWNIQTRNTDEDNFQWEQDTFNIKVAEAGLYEITMAFFTKTKPSVQLVVNGESIMSAINSPSYIVHHSSGYVIDGNGKMQEGVVSGLSLVDFLALPSKSTISVHYHGVKKQTLGHGFLGLRKL